MGPSWVELSATEPVIDISLHLLSSKLFSAYFIKVYNKRWTIVLSVKLFACMCLSLNLTGTIRNKRVCLFICKSRNSIIRVYLVVMSSSRAGSSHSLSWFQP